MGFINLVPYLKVPSVTFSEIDIITTIVVRGAWDDISNSSNVIDDGIALIDAVEGYVPKIL